MFQATPTFSKFDALEAHSKCTTAANHLFVVFAADANAERSLEIAKEAFAKAATILGFRLEPVEQDTAPAHAIAAE